MKFKIINKTEVYNDIFEVTEYYLKISYRLADEFLIQLEIARKYILEFPYSIDVSYKTIRTHLLNQFPYQIHFTINESNNQIIILAVTFAKLKNLDFSHRL